MPADVLFEMENVREGLVAHGAVEDLIRVDELPVVPQAGRAGIGGAAELTDVGLLPLVPPQVGLQLGLFYEPLVAEVALEGLELKVEVK